MSGMNETEEALARLVEFGLKEARENGADSSCDYGDMEQIVRAILAAMPHEEPVAWQYRSKAMDGWRETLMPIEKFKSRDVAGSMIADGFVEIRPLYAAPLSPWQKRA